MSYDSVDQLQKVLAAEVFHYAKDAKKAAGRALGTMVEIITFYLLKSWGLEQSLSIERSLAEFGNPEITHNVEFSLHPILQAYPLSLKAQTLPVNAKRLFAELSHSPFDLSGFRPTGNTLLTRDRVLRNACTIGYNPHSYLLATLTTQDFFQEAYITVVEQHRSPYAMVECKRVGIEEGAKKGPQTIEKAKQGAYVARSVSSLHKVRQASGELRGLIYKPDGTLYSLPYEALITEIVTSEDADLLRDFILTVGVVSNHGNWFTSNNHNKELKVLAQSYDWLVFLTDEGLADFITNLLLKPLPALQPAREAFIASYTSDKKRNQFTKVQMHYDADRVLEAYFANTAERIERWFSIIAPKGYALSELRTQISLLRQKDWKVIHAR